MAKQQLTGKQRPDTPASTAGTPVAADDASSYPGKRFGLPERGSMSVPGIFRRLAALCVDWLLSLVIALSVTHSRYWTIAFFTAEIYILTVFTGTTLGKRLLGMRVVRTDGGRVGPGPALIRTLLLLLVIPPLVSDRDVRGLHDRAAGTIVVRI